MGVSYYSPSIILAHNKDYHTTIRIASGSYAGNDTANRAIPHGLSGKPKFVRISPADTNNFLILQDTKLEHYAGAAGNIHTVTAKDATNFYVGNAASYNTSANASGTTYYWVAWY